MKKLKMCSILSAILAFSVLLSACGGSTSTSTESNSKSGDKKEYTIKVSYENQPGEPVDLAAHEWKRLAEEKSKGQIKMELYPSSQLGSKADMIEQMKLGTGVIQIADASFLMDYVPDIGILSAPYLADSYDDLQKLTKSEWFAGLDKELQGKGLHMVTTNWIYGDRHLITQKPIKKPSDLKGLKIRVPNNQLSIKTIEKMGATPTPMPLGEVYPAIAQGVIDGMENPLPVIHGSKVYENAKHVTLTGHVNMLLQWVAGQTFIETLPEDLVKVLKETGNEAGEFQNKSMLEVNEKLVEDLKKAGVTISEVDQPAFREAVKDIYSDVESWSPGLYEKVQKTIKEGK
ncbi:tripartite ATP-independent transporter DctP family solute receptor [Neobacillus niacini]|uniref:C4-dicarboxylate TRAP transporter substrate-binding protein n=1 Tax=Neobacillus niacini TaxID=86668 RepID=UPI00285B8AB0|nr:C4-dicarboxylate TRAP transporter substrate-binding protein [Neobacillus niacini]MDR7080020.1 tripartite ATP-independent transporter DctP family solute receptor [Neobacillus niacini]